MAGARILVIEDDPEIAQLLGLYLSHDGLEFDGVPNAEEGLERCRRGPAPALIVLDLNLPGMDGFQFLRELRSFAPWPVLIVSSRNSDEDKIAGLGLGGDDFMTKPFSVKFLVAKVQALLRRSRHQAPVPTRLRFGPFEADWETQRLMKEGRAIELRKKEWDLLAFLLKQPGKPFLPDQLYREVWGQEYGDLTTVAVHIQRLRRKLGEPPGAPQFLKTLPGFGYCLVLKENP